MTGIMMTVFVRLLHPHFVFLLITTHLENKNVAFIDCRLGGVSCSFYGTNYAHYGRPYYDCEM